MKYKTILGQYDESSRKPIVKEIRYSVKNKFREGYVDSAFPTRYLQIYVIFDKSMDHFLTKIDGSEGQLIQLEELGSTIAIPDMVTSGSWTSIYQEYDTFVTDEIELLARNLGFLNLRIGYFRDEYGNEIIPHKKKAALNVSRKSLIYSFSTSKYLTKKDMTIDIIVPFGSQARFSLNNEDWTSYQSFDEYNELNTTLDVTDTSIGGTSASYVGRLYMDVESVDGILDQISADFVYNTEAVPMSDLLVESREGEVIAASTWQSENQPVVKLKAPNSLISIEGFSYAVDSAPNDIIDVAQASVIDAGCKVVSNIKTSSSVSLLSQFEVKKASYLNGQFSVTGVSNGKLNSQFEIDEICKNGNCWYLAATPLLSQFEVIGSGILPSQLEVIANGKYKANQLLYSQFNVQCFGITVKKGYYYLNSNKRKHLAEEVAIEAASTTNYRRDLVCLDFSEGDVEVFKGGETSLSSPVAPTAPFGYVSLAWILVPPGSVDISGCIIEDRRDTYTKLYLLGNKLADGQYQIRAKAKDILGNVSGEKAFDIWVETDTPHIDAVTGIDYISGGTVLNAEFATMSSTCYLSWTAPDEYGDIVYYVTTDGSIPDEFSARQGETGLFVELPGAGIFEIKIRPKTDIGWGPVKIFTVEKAQNANELDGYIIFSE